MSAPHDPEPRDERPPDDLTVDELRDAWALLSPDERMEGYGLLRHGPGAAEQFFLEADVYTRKDLLKAVTAADRRTLFRLLPPDDAADLIQEMPDDKEALLGFLDEAARDQVRALLAYEADAAGGLMDPRYARVRPEQTVQEAINYLRLQTSERAGSSHYVYVLGPDQRLLGVFSYRELFFAPADCAIEKLMRTRVVTVPEDADPERLSSLLTTHRLWAIPVVDAGGRMKGIVTADDLIGAVQEGATEDIQRLGGMDALDAPYLAVDLRTMVRKRGGWLALLFFGEMLTASAMSMFEDELAKALVLALFIPLIISSGGNSGSQATTLVIRAMALGEVRLRDWWRVARREIAAGLALGLLLAVLGLVRVLVWEGLFGEYGEYWLLVALTVSFSLVGVVMFGTLTGSMLPFVLRRFGLDPASASAPFVATMVDVTGLMIYFTVASLLLTGALL